MWRRLGRGVVTALLLAACSGTAVGPEAGSAVPVTTAPGPPDSATTSTTSATSMPRWSPDTSYVPFEVDPDGACLARAVFGDPAESPYLLPFPAGERYSVSQSYCIQTGGHHDQIAYDFVMPVGKDVLAMRAGQVIRVVESWPDDGEGPGEHNEVLILHDDGTVAFYAHLRQDGVDVSMGEWVEAGDRIGASGRSGQVARAHLHVAVFHNRSSRGAGDTLPFNFRNAEGSLDPRGGLVTGSVYEALPPG